MQYILTEEEMRELVPRATYNALAESEAAKTTLANAFYEVVGDEAEDIRQRIIAAVDANVKAAPKFVASVATIIVAPKT